MSEAAYKIRIKNFTTKFDTNIIKKQVKYCTWSLATHGVENWKLRMLDEKYPSSFTMW
jgi:hypothetical protein